VLGNKVTIFVMFARSRVHTGEFRNARQARIPFVSEDLCAVRALLYQIMVGFLLRY
jgi:hypothetical protein